LIPDYEEELKPNWGSALQREDLAYQEDPDAQAERQRRESIATFRDALRIVAACAVASLLAMAVMLAWAAWGPR